MFGVKRISGIPYVKSEETELLLDLYLPDEAKSFPLLVFFYGGGLEGGSREDLTLLAEEFAGAGIGVALPDYRLMPAVSFPVPVEDGAASVAWLKSHIQEYGCVEGVFAGGHSAGAHIAMMLCFDKRFLSQWGMDSDELNGYLFCSGQPTTHFNVLKYRGEDPRLVLIDDCAPIRHIRSAGAPLQILCGDRDMENRLEQTQLMVSTLRHFNYNNHVDFQLLTGHDHGSYLERRDQEHSLFFELASGFIARHCKKNP